MDVCYFRFRMIAFCGRRSFYGRPDDLDTTGKFHFFFPKVNTAFRVFFEFLQFPIAAVNSQFRRLVGRIHQLTGFTNIAISKWILYAGLATCLLESIADFKFRTVDFETYFLFLYVLVIAIGITPMLHSQQRIAESNPSAPNNYARVLHYRNQNKHQNIPDEAG